MVKQHDAAASHDHDVSPSTTSKRKRLDDPVPEPIAALKKKPRNRVSFSCGECHRRKQKCDRQSPCGHCVSRKVPELCKAYTPGKTEQDLHMRIARLEHIIEKALPQYSSSSPFANGDDHRDRSPSSIPGEGDDDEITDDRLRSGTWHGISAIGSVSSAPILEQLQSMMPHEPLTSETQIRDSISHLARLTSCSKELALAAEHLNAARSGDPASLLAATKIIDAIRHYADPTSGGLNPAGAVGLALPTLLDSDASVTEKFKSLIQDCGVSPHKISELLQDLPSKRQSDSLVDFYFTTINYTRYSLNEKEFRIAYQAICATDGLGVNPNDIKFLPLLFLVLAIAVRVAPASLTGDDRQRRLTSLRYYWSSRRSLLFAAAIHNDSFELVWVRLLSARFLTFDRRITEAWSQLGAAVRTAQALGLHRDGLRMGLDYVQTQRRRSLWAHVYHADRSFSLVMGRPQCILDDYTSSRPPLNIDEEELLANPTNPPDHPLTRVTSMSFVILRHQLATIIGRICHHFQQVRQKPHYSEVLELEDDLGRFTASLPPHFSLDPDTSLDVAHPHLPAHRAILLTEIMFVRMSLHRPYILRRLDSDRFAKSRRACFDAAKKDFILRTKFRQETPQRVLGTGGAYREFQTAMISGIALMLDPNGPDAPDMKAIMDAFLSDHEDTIDLDDTTRRELKIIEFLKSKSSGLKSHHENGSMTATNSNEPAPGAKSEDIHTLKSNGARKEDKEDTLLTTRPPVSSLRHTPISNVNEPPPYVPSISSPPRYPIPGTLISRLQNIDVAVDSPPAASASPGDDSNTAQTLLDHWYDTVSNGPPPDLFAATGTATSLPLWNPSTEYPDGLTGIPLMNYNGPLEANGNAVEADLNYWETMFNMLPNASRTTS